MESQTANHKSQNKTISFTSSGFRHQHNQVSLFPNDMPINVNTPEASRMKGFQNIYFYGFNMDGPYQTNTVF